MKKYVRSMAENKVESFKSCVAQWVAYEVYMKLKDSESTVRVSDNKPGKLLVLSSTNNHPDQNTVFQITSKSIDTVMLVVESDNFQIIQDAPDAVTTILNY